MGQGTAEKRNNLEKKSKKMVILKNIKPWFAEPGTTSELQIMQEKKQQMFKTDHILRKFNKRTQNFKVKQIQKQQDNNKLSKIEQFQIAFFSFF
jgi:hypothetical protein